MHLPTPVRPSGSRRLVAVCATVAAVALAPLVGVPGLGFAEPDGHAQHVRTVAADRDDAGQDRDTAGQNRNEADQDRNEADQDRDPADQNRDGADQDRNDDGQDDGQDADRNDDRGRSEASGDTPEVAAGGKDGKNNGLDVLGRDCSQSKLDTHDGFQKSPACVTTQMGEVAAEDKLPSLVIKDAPKEVKTGEAFTLEVSTRNLVRDRFLGAAAGGYYLEASFLNDEGLQRGHFHTACRILPPGGDAPDSSGEPEFFLATEDGKGGTDPDTVTVEVPGIDKPGDLQCTSWAGDGSHRTPMMTKANQTPAIDSVRISVTE